ncbi:hypothetical protein KAR91_69770 [Candidatus Pacearchaeota archaeon]|nr:hypothetical protein [Candidatus Pacearchaeota archaeon]
MDAILTEKAKKIYDHFGKDNQIKKFNEEIVEYITAKTGENRLEEMGDIFLVLLQFFLRHRGFRKMVMDKADRTLYRIKTRWYEEKVNG